MDTPPSRRLPSWLARPIPSPGKRRAVSRALARHDLPTVCTSARCPNQNECYSSGTATFLILGNVCSRACRFCAVASGTPKPVDRREPEAVAEAVEEMRLEYAVVTSVTRDDLPDGGAGQFAATIGAIRGRNPACRVEVLTPDFGGDSDALATVANARPDVYNHNVETVPRLYDRVRPGADFERSIRLLAEVKRVDARVKTKSGLMVGFGETRAEIEAVLGRLRRASCDGITIGQYLAPEGCLPVADYLSPEEFTELADFARAIGFSMVAAGPLVRSSYHAAELAAGGGA